MQISTDVYSLRLLRDGMKVTEILRDSSLTYIEKLKNYNLVYIDQADRVYLTDKGELAKKMGLEKFLELEKLEKELTKNPMKETFWNKWLFLLTCCLQLILTAVLIYIIVVL